MNTKEEVVNWVKGQFYCDEDCEDLCEDYENWDEQSIQEAINDMVYSLCKKLSIEVEDE